jgi:hypothetical protein
VVDCNRVGLFLRFSPPAAGQFAIASILAIIFEIFDVTAFDRLFPPCLDLVSE